MNPRHPVVAPATVPAGASRPGVSRGRAERFTIAYGPSSGGEASLAKDALEGLSRRCKSLPPKYFYDERGCKLFAAICDLPEYYLTRTEQSLLEANAAEVIRVTRPAQLVEIGSGNARKTRALLDAIGNAGLETIYVPFDVSESTLRESSLALLGEYPWLRIRGLVGDYERDLAMMPAGEPRLVAFLGSTIGNLDRRQTARFLSRLAARLGPRDHFLLGTDLVKPRRLLEDAYDDAAGVTAEFNLNLLGVLNRELGARFDPAAFEHVARFNARAERIEIYLRSRRDQRVPVARLGRSFRFARGELMRTEISRKFTRASVERMLARAGLRLARWFTPPDSAFALSLSKLA
jgi:L-histidine N-alpha-methyltransferase